MLSLFNYDQQLHRCTNLFHAKNYGVHARRTRKTKNARFLHDPCTKRVQDDIIGKDCLQIGDLYFIAQLRDLEQASDEDGVM